MSQSLKISDVVMPGTKFHAVKNIVNFLSKCGYHEFCEGQRWNLSAGVKGYVTRNQSAVIAFDVPAKVAATMPLRIGMAHTDSPMLRLRTENASIVANQTRIPVDIYGGAINASWLDRPLKIGGRIIYEHGGKSSTRFVDSDNAIAVIPNPPPHLQRNLNSEGFAYGASALTAVVANKEWQQFLAASTEHLNDKCLAAELYLYNGEEAKVAGDRIYCQCLDDLTGCYGILAGLLDKRKHPSLAIAGFFDNEEVGSQSYQGASGSFLRDVLERICRGLNFDLESQKCLFANGWLASVDAAHALNPNFSELYDRDMCCLLGGGVALKVNTNLRYATEADGEAKCRMIAEHAKIQLQKFAVPPCSSCGSTIGPMMSSALGIRCVDIGIGMWAMHSICETASVSDIHELAKFMGKFYEC